MEGHADIQSGQERESESSVVEQKQSAPASKTAPHQSSQIQFAQELF